MLGRRKLRAKLNFMWKNINLEVLDFVKSKRTVYSIECDDTAVYCGTLDGFIEVYDVATGNLKHELCCKSSSASIDCVQFSIGDDNLASLTESGNICIWNKENGNLEYQAKHHGEVVAVYGIKVSANIVMTGATDGSIFVLEKERENQWVVKRKVFVNDEEISHIDIDEGWLVTGTISSIKLWSLAELDEGPRLNNIDVNPWMLLLHFPFLFVVGGERWPGFQVWNVETNIRIRNFKLDCKLFHTLSSSGDFIVFCELAMLWPGDEPKEVVVLTFNIKELCDENITDEKLWRRERLCVQRFSEGEVNAAVNMTSLLVAHGNRVDIQNFWT